MICLGCDYNKKVQDLTHQFYRKSEAKAEDSSVSLSGSLPAFSPLLPEAQHLLLPPPLSPRGSLQWRHAVLIESDPDSSFFQTAPADAPLFSSPPAVDNWPFGWGALRCELWPRCFDLSPLSLPLSPFANTHLGPTPHGVGGNRSRHLFLSCRNYSGENCSRINGSGPQEVKKNNLLMVLAASRRNYSCIILFTH